METIIGHKKSQKVLKNILASRGDSLSLIFSGPEKVGKKMLAQEIAQEIIGKDFSLIHPDFIFLEPEIEEKRGKIKKKEISIEDIREAQKKLGLSSISSKVFIVDEAQMMTKSAQNSFLKTLEEPPKNSIIILIVQDEVKILDTIKSRCQKVNFSLVSEKEIESFVPKDHPQREAIIFWSIGRPGIAKDLLEDKEKLNFRKEVFEELKKILTLSLSEKFRIIENISKDVPTLILRLELWEIIFRNSLKKNRFLQKNSSKQTLDIIEKIEETIDIIKNTNSNVRLAMENLILYL